MATIGDILTTPESGWTRYQIENIPNIVFSNASSTSTTGTGVEGGTSYVFTNTSAKATFQFEGTALLIRAYLNGSGASFNVKIDGISETFTISRNDVHYGVAYIKTGLKPKVHDVEITVNNATAKWIDTIDFIETDYKVNMVIKNPTTSKVYSLHNKTLIHLPSSSDENIILHGIERGKEIKLDEAFDKMKYVKDVSEVLGEGKKFTHTVDMSKTKINKIIL